MTPEEELKLQGDMVTGLLNKISDLKRQAVEEQSHFYVANVLGECYEVIKSLHIISVQTAKENLKLTDHKRLYFAGKALQGLLAGANPEQGYCCNIVEEAFQIADNMVNYGKQDSKTKCTDDGTGTTPTEDSNNV